MLSGVEACPVPVRCVPFDFAQGDALTGFSTLSGHGITHPAGRCSSLWVGCKIKWEADDLSFIW